MLTILRTAIAWWAPLVVAAVVALLFAAIGFGNLTAMQQVAVGAFTGGSSALAVFLFFYERRHPGDIWKPAFDVARAQKLIGFATVAAGAADFILKFVNMHAAMLTAAPLACLTLLTGCLLRVQKLTAMEERTSWTS
jgi:hypothetical protein